MNDLIQKLRPIAELTRDDVGISEENVKQKIVVPLLERLGHHRNQLDFEYGTGRKRIDIFIRGLPIDCKVIIDTKNYDEDLSSHLEQIGLYAFQEGALLALIINGEEIRVYDPFFRGFSFRDSLLYSLRRGELADDKNADILCKLISRGNLENRKVKDFIIIREQEIMDAYSQIEKTKTIFERKKKGLLDKKEKLIQQIDDIQDQVRKIADEINQLGIEKDDKVNRTLNAVGLPYLRTMPQELTPSYVQEIRTRNVFAKADRVEIVLHNLHTPRKYGLIPVPKEYRGFFPGYKVPFILQTDIGEITTRVTSAPKGTKVGNAAAGAYIQGGLKPWYKTHRELRGGDKLVIKVIEPKKRYSLMVER